MAFAGAFFRQIGKVSHGKSNLARTTHPQPASSLNVIITSNSSKKSSSGDVDSWLNIYNGNEYTEANYPGVLDSQLTSLTTAQRHIFTVILVVLFVLSLCGNICTLLVNFRRQLRPFFRACLISLALSDLMNTVSLATSYFAQFTVDFVQIWSLGDVMCSLVPFATTCAILASSMTLVGIAFDRYIAVMKVVNGVWNPSVISCIACMLCIWLASISIACPVFTFYSVIPVHILTEEQENATAAFWPTAITTTEKVVGTNAPTTSSLLTDNDFVIMTPKIPHIKMREKVTLSMTAATFTDKNPALEQASSNLLYTLIKKQRLVKMCVPDQKNVSVYYFIAFAIVFVPTIAAFFWLNSVITRKLWKRRRIALKTPTAGKSKPKQPKYISSNYCSSQPRPSVISHALFGSSVAKSVSTSIKLNIKSSNTRETRHLRMFTVILIMMAVFVFLRLPSWIFLLMRMNGNYSQPYCWILYFVFGLMNLSSSVLNPLFYTFLTETIKYVLRTKAKISSLLRASYCQHCCSRSTRNYETTDNFAASPCFPNKPGSRTRCKNTIIAIHNDNDAGVECNDELQRIYTIFIQ